MTESAFVFKGKDLCFSLHGKGNPLVLIHGYLADSNIWGSFANDLAKHFQVIMIDLPGHGNSDLNSSVNRMDVLAESVHAVLTQLKIEQANFVGHSMGGYVALAYLQKYPSNVSSLTLLNSNPWQDDEQRVENRNKEIQLIESGKKEMLIKFNIANSISKANREKLRKTIQKLEVIALAQPEAGIVSMLKGMKYREDRADLLELISLPILFILGADDEKIDSLKVVNSFSSFPHISIKVLENTGHLSFMESPEECLKILLNFLSSI